MREPSQLLRKTQQNEPHWNKTRRMAERLHKNGFFEEKGLIKKERFYQGRPVISRDTPINGGVYLGDGEREAIVIDDKKDEALERIFQELLERRQNAKQRFNQSFKQGILEEIWNLVNQVMPFDEARVTQIITSLPTPDSKIYLSAFIGGGICRHQALLIAYLLERLVGIGLLGGHVSIDRNYIPSMGGHAWARYTNSAGNVYILDSALNYIGLLDEVSEEKWFYERPEDVRPLLKLKAKLLRKFF